MPDIIIDIATGAQEHEKQNSCLSGRLAGVLIRHERQLSIVLRPSNQIWRWQAMGQLRHHELYAELPQRGGKRSFTQAA